MFLVHLIYWTHWILDIAFAAACFSVAFKPHIIARLYVVLFLAQQLILNGCIMTLLQNKAEAHVGVVMPPNRFIMSEIISNQFIIVLYKLVFLLIIAFQLYYITKEIQSWKNKNKVA